MIEVEQFDNEAPAPLVLGDDSLLLCNEPPSRFWMHSGYKEQDVHRLCSEINKEWMFAMVTFHGEGKLSFSVSQRTWDRGEGHYPVVMELFRAVANDPRLVNARGSFVVWLEDGMWDWCQPLSRRAPVVAFGRNVRDSTTFLMPDPAFVGALGYSLDRKQAERFAAQIGWSHRRPTIFWRGAATGIGIEGPEWSQTTRSKLVLEAKKIGDRGVVDAKLTRIGHLPHEAKQILLSEGVVDEEVPFDTFFNFKYVVDADGYHCAWKSLYLKLMMGSVVLKMDSSFEQWYHRNLMPWRHYIPMSKDLKELREIHQWLLNHDEAAQEISRAGADFISKVNLESALDGMVMIVENILGAWRE